MIIDQLPALATAGDNDEIAIEVGTTTYKIKKSDFLKEFMPKSGGEFTGNVTVGGVLDVTQRRCYANLSQQGWYRALKVTGGFGGGVRSFSVDINITRSYDGTDNEVHCVKLLCVYDGNSIFTNEVSKSNVLLIDKIRYYNVSGGDGYLDIHYAGSATNETSVDFTVHVASPSKNRFTAISLEPVADSPSGVTALTTYEFTANGIRTVTLTSAHSSVTINGQKVARSGQVVSLWVDFTVSTSISGYDYLIYYAPTFASSANALVYNAWNTVQTNVRLYADEGSYGLRCYGEFPAGRYVAFITYITTDV